MHLKLFSVAILGVLATTSIADAAVIDNTSLYAPPGVYFGSGNSNSGFTVDREGSYELGLSAIQRYVGPITPTGNVYNVNTGTTSVPTKTGSDWGFVFSVNLDAGGGGNLFTSGFTPILTMTDVGKGTTGHFNLLAIPDNTVQTVWTGTCSPEISCGPYFFAFQNSEALSYNSIATALGDPTYDINANDTYNFTLDLYRDSSLTTKLASDSISVVAGKGATPVPEPMTLSLFGAGLVGMGFAARRRSKKALAA